jgi:hypothetical protein
VRAININDFILANAFCRPNNDYGGSCIFVKKGIITKELNSLNELGEEENFELSLIELVQYRIIVICIYRTPDGQFDIFLNELDLITQKLIVKYKIVILCGDWNINFIQNSPQERELNSLLLRYNLKHTVNIPTTITKTTATLLDVMITNESNLIGSSVVGDLGLSDHHALVPSIPISEFSNAPYRIKRRQFSEDNVQEFFIY